MSFERGVYAVLVRLHPAEFRRDFGPEMLLDYDEARTRNGLYWDALVSLGRQWGRLGIAGERQPVPVGARFLLDGWYGVIGADGLSAFEFGRGMVLAVGLIGGLVVVQGHTLVGSDPASASSSRSAKVGFQPERAMAGDGPRKGEGRGRIPASVAQSKVSEMRPPAEVSADAEAERSGLRPSGFGGTPSQVSGARPGAPSLVMMKAAFVRSGRMGETGAVWETARGSAGGGARGPKGPMEENGPAVGLIAHPSDEARRISHPVSVVRLEGQGMHATGPLPNFEVVSIRLWKRPPAPPPVAADQPGAPKPVMKVDPGSGRPRVLKSARWHSIVPVQVLIATAYNLPPDSKRVMGGPGWLREDIQYEITAKIGDEMFAAMQKMTPEEQQTQMQLLEQSLLADRFGLKAHFEQREMPMFTLEVAKNGAKLTPAVAGEVSRLENFADERGGGMKGTAVGLDQLAQSPLLLGGRLVVNKTGLTGSYDFTLRFAGESGDGDSPGLYTALQDQMGLKLVATKGMVEVLVIDSVEKPTEN